MGNMSRIVGIDLGTTTSEIAYIRNGKPEIIKNGYSSITPSVVGLDKNLEIFGGTIRQKSACISKGTDSCRSKAENGNK